MSWDFYGHTTIGGTQRFEQNTIGGTDYECETVRQPNDPLPVNNVCGLNPWRFYQERRITIAKQALVYPDGFIDQLGANDSMRIIAFSADRIDTTSGWSSDKSVLKSTVMNTGKYNNDRYRTSGGDASARAMLTARQIWETQPPTAPNGQPYRQVTIFITDSVAYAFLNGTKNTALDVCPEFHGDVRATDTARCQVDLPSYPINSNGRRPITELIAQASGIKTTYPNMQLYVVALASVDLLGLDEVASTPNMLYQVPTPADLAPALEAIHSQVMASFGSTCISASGNQWLDHIDATHAADSPPFDLPSGTYGNVYIYRDGDDTPFATAPITQDTSGKLTFTTSGLVPGTYHTQAYLAYKGDDQVSRQYNWMIDPNTLQGSSSATFQIAAGDAGETLPLDRLFLDLRPENSVCP
jgi:hypothetical protein